MSQYANASSEASVVVEDDVARLERRPPGGGGDMKPWAGCCAPKTLGVGSALSIIILSCSSTFRNVSLSNLSERDGGRGIPGLGIGGRLVVGLRGEVGLDLERESLLLYVGGEMGLLEMMGDGACICIDMARVGGPRAGTSACLMRMEGGRRDGVELCKNAKEVSTGICGGRPD